MVTKNPVGDLTPTEEGSMFDYSDSKQYVFPLVQNESNDSQIPVAYHVWDGLGSWELNMES